MLKTAASSVIKYSGLLLALAYLVWMHLRNEVPVDAGDGVIHYSIAKQVFTEPRYLLDHWGKPLFTLLASGFAQFGFAWYIGFNILVFTATCFVVFGILRIFRTAAFYCFLFPLLLICVPDYTYCVLGGMTEPLFGLLLALSVLLALKQRWMVFALIVSLLPFARSEGMLAVALALPLLALVRQWKALPLLAAGFSVYAIAGWLLIGDPWWYFTDDPYGDTTIYGSGPWWWYLNCWKAHFGLITLLLLPFGLFGCLVLWKKRAVPHFAWIVLFAFGVYAGIFVAHSYLWAAGEKGAAGLTRLPTMALPAVTALILAGCHAVSRELNSIPHIVGSLLLLLLIGKETSELPYPRKADPLQRALIDATDYVLSHYPGRRIYYFHPLIPWKMNIGAKEQHPLAEQRYFNGDERVRGIMVTGMEEGAVLIRDPQFGPMEQGLTPDLIAKYPEKMIAVKRFPAEGVHVTAGEEPAVVVYEIGPAKKAVPPGQ